MRRLSHFQSSHVRLPHGVLATVGFVIMVLCAMHMV